MRIINFLIPILLLLNVNATYYVDYTEGSDSNNGTSTLTAWKNVTKVEATSLSAGDNVLFQCNELFPTTSPFDIPSSGSLGNPIIFGSYGTGAKPIIDCVNVITGSTTSGNWTDTGGNVWTMSLATNPVRVWFDGTEQPSADTGTHTIGSTYRWRWASSTLYVYSASGNPATVPIALKGLGDCLIVLNFNNKSNVTVQNLDLRGGSIATVQMRGPTNQILENNTIGYGSTGINAQGQSAGCTSASLHTGLIIRNNYLDGQQRFTASGYDDMSGVGEGIFLRNGISAPLVYGNTIANYPHSGVTVENLSASCWGVQNARIYENEIHSADSYDGRCFSFIGTEGSVQYNEFTRNYCHHQTTQSKLDGNNNIVHHNTYAHVRNPIYNTASSNPIAGAVIFLSTASGLASHDNILAYNTFYDIDAEGVRFDQQASPSEIKYNNIVHGNIFVNTGLNTSASLTDICINLEKGTNIGPNTITNNLCYNTNASTSIYRYNTTNYTATNFNALDGTTPDAGSGNHVIQNQSTADPLFTNAGSDNFKLLAASPAINAGATIYGFIDFDGSSATKDGTLPDQGASEYGGAITTKGITVINGVKFN